MMERLKVTKTGGGGYRLAIVDYLKAICIVLVIFNHTGIFDVSKPIYIMVVNTAVPVFMILSGYVMGLTSAEKSMAQLYEGNRLLRKLFRYVVPMLITFFLFEVGQSILSMGAISGWEIAHDFFLFDYGPGSYYFAMMIEFLFLSPAILWAVKRYNFHGVLLTGLMDFFYEICCSSYGISKEIYRILVFRYLFAISIGMYMGLHKNKEIRNEHLLIIFSIGMIFKLLPDFFNYRYRIFTGATAAETSLFAVMYIFPIIYLVLFYGYGHTSTSKIGRILELIGRASYHIMCTQMIYFCVRHQYVFEMSKLGKVSILLFDTMVSLLTGITFYYVDNCFLTGRLIRRVMRPRRNIDKLF